MITYKVNIKEQDFELDNSQLSTLDLAQLPDGRFHLIHKNTNYDIEIDNIDVNDKSCSLYINGNLYTMSINDHHDALVEQMGYTSQETITEKDIKTPMPGLILEILVEVGSEIEEGDPLFILEAMKMENIIKANGSGIVKSILSKKGKAVEKGEMIIELDG